MSRLEAFYKRVAVSNSLKLYRKSPEDAKPLEIFWSLKDTQRFFLMKLVALKKKQGNFNKKWLKESLQEFHEDNYTDFHMSLFLINNDSRNDLI